MFIYFRQSLFEVTYIDFRWEDNIKTDIQMSGDGWHGMIKLRGGTSGGHF